MADPSTQPAGSTFLDSQVATYGRPRAARQPSQPQQPQGPTTTPWMPNGAPTAAPAAQAQPAPTYAPAIQQAPAQSAGSVNAQGVYTPGAAPQQTYAPQQIQQYQAPSNPQIDARQQQLLQGILNSPQTLSPQVISQMKGQNADQAAILSRQDLGQLKAQLAGRGMASDVGYGMGQQRAINQQTNQNILNNNRQIDLTAAQQNRQDTINALGLADQFQNSQSNRALQNFQGQLAGVGANRDEATTALQSMLQNYNAGLAGNQLASQSALGAAGNALQGQQLAQQGQQFNQNFGLDTDKFNYQKTVDDRQFGMQGAAQAQQASQWADQMAFNYQKANEDDYNSLISYLLGPNSGQ